jgi:hypothetical protein
MPPGRGFPVSAHLALTPFVDCPTTQISPERRILIRVFRNDQIVTGSGRILLTASVS